MLAHFAHLHPILGNRTKARWESVWLAVIRPEIAERSQRLQNPIFNVSASLRSSKMIEKRGKMLIDSATCEASSLVKAQQMPPRNSSSSIFPEQLTSLRHCKHFSPQAQCQSVITIHQVLEPNAGHWNYHCGLLQYTFLLSKSITMISLYITYNMFCITNEFWNIWNSIRTRIAGDNANSS